MKDARDAPLLLAIPLYATLSSRAGGPPHRYTLLRLAALGPSAAPGICRGRRCSDEEGLKTVATLGTRSPRARQADGWEEEGPIGRRARPAAGAAQRPWAARAIGRPGLERLSESRSARGPEGARIRGKGAGLPRPSPHQLLVVRLLAADWARMYVEGKPLIL